MNLKRASALAPLLLMILGGCGNEERVRSAGATIGVARAGISIPDIPGECRKQYAHATVRPGDEAVVAIDRERAVTNAANLTIRNCAAWNDALRKEMSGAIDAPGPKP